MNSKNTRLAQGENNSAAPLVSITVSHSLSWNGCGAHTFSVYAPSPLVVTDLHLNFTSFSCGDSSLRSDSCLLLTEVLAQVLLLPLVPLVSTIQRPMMGATNVILRFSIAV